MSDRSERIRATADLARALTFLARERATERSEPIGTLVAAMGATRTWYHHRSGKGAPDLGQLKTYARVLCNTDDEKAALFELAAKSSGSRLGRDMIVAALESNGNRSRDLADPKFFLKFCDTLLDPKTSDRMWSSARSTADALEAFTFRELRRRSTEVQSEQRRFVIGHRLGLVGDQLDDLDLHLAALRLMRKTADWSALAQGTVLDFEAMFVSAFDQVWSPAEDVEGWAIRDRFLAAEELYRLARENDPIHREFGFPDQVTAAGLNACRVALHFERAPENVFRIKERVVAIDFDDQVAGVGPASLAHNAIGLLDAELAVGEWDQATERLAGIRAGLATVGALTEYWSIRLDYMAVRLAEQSRVSGGFSDESREKLIDCAVRFRALGNSRRAQEAYRRSVLSK
jgi:hypothetical protein